MPPPYRAPPPGLIPNNNNQHPPPPPKGSSLPYSRFNVSEPNIGQYKSSPVGYRHTINHENSSAVQTNLKQMLSMPKHQTLDMNGQNTAIQHLRMQEFELKLHKLDPPCVMHQDSWLTPRIGSKRERVQAAVASTPCSSVGHKEGGPETLVKIHKAPI